MKSQAVEAEGDTQGMRGEEKNSHTGTGNFYSDCRHDRQIVVKHAIQTTLF